MHLNEAGSNWGQFGFFLVSGWGFPFWGTNSFCSFCLCQVVNHSYPVWPSLVQPFCSCFDLQLNFLILGNSLAKWRYCCYPAIYTSEGFFISPSVWKMNKIFYSIGCPHIFGITLLDLLVLLGENEGLNDGESIFDKLD